MDDNWNFEAYLIKLGFVEFRENQRVTVYKKEYLNLRDGIHTPIYVTIYFDDTEGFFLVNGNYTPLGIRITTEEYLSCDMKEVLFYGLQPISDFEADLLFNLVLPTKEFIENRSSINED